MPRGSTPYREGDLPYACDTYPDGKVPKRAVASGRGTPRRYNFDPMELAKSFEPSLIEAKWYPLWESSGYFKPSMRPGAPPFCIQLPPPNVTGTLHMGHAFQQTLMDLMIRYHRMRGDNTLWQVGTDHAGIATQIVVEQQLKAQGKSRATTSGRAAFVERVWAWKEESGSAITRQMRRLGRLRRLVARALHDGRGIVGRRARDVRAPVRRRAHLSRQAARQLGPEARHGGVGPRSRQRGRAGQAVADPLSVCRRQRRSSSSPRRARRRCWATSPSR